MAPLDVNVLLFSAAEESLAYFNDSEAALVFDTEVRALYLYHHDPASADADMDKIHAQSRKIIAARGSALKRYVARESMALVLSET